MSDAGIQPDPPPPPPADAAAPLAPPVTVPDLQRRGEPLRTIIPYTNPKALSAYYCGIFALIPGVGALLGLFALVLGIIGLRTVRRNPQAKGTGHAVAGIVLGVVTLLVNWGAITWFLIEYNTDAAFREGLEVLWE
jgi:hypothetical protein